MQTPAKIKVVDVTKDCKNSMAFLADNPLLEARMGTDD